MPPDRKEQESAELSRVHERLDDVLFELQKIASSQAELTTACKPCREKITQLDKQWNGNGTEGLRVEFAKAKERMDKLERGEKDTFSIKSFGIILAAVGTFVGAIAAAIGGVVAAVVARGQ